MSDSNNNNNDQGDDNGGGKRIGDILKKAVSLGAGAYIKAEDTVTKTWNTVQIPKELLRDAIESFFESYTVTVQAEIKLTPKKKSGSETEEKKK